LCGNGLLLKISGGITFGYKRTDNVQLKPKRVMKKLILAFSLLLGGVGVYAQDTTSTDQTQTQQPYPTMQEQDREKINSRDLPDAVKRSLENQDYRGWLVNGAYKTKGVGMSANQNQSDSAAVQSDSTSVSGNAGAYGQEVFVVELKNGAQTKTVRFDKDGKKLDDQGPENDQK
jgi:hypothetical protein